MIRAIPIEKISYAVILLLTSVSIKEKMMIELLAKSIAAYLYREKVIDDQDRDLCQYGIEVILSNATGIIIIILMSIWGDCLWQGIVFLMLYSTLRIYTGGYHASTYLKCNIYFAIVFLMTICSFNIFKYINLKNVISFLVLLGFLVVGALAPVENKNKSLSHRDKNIYRKTSIGIYAALMMVLLIGDSIDYDGSLFGINMLYWYDFSLYIKTVLCSIVVLMLCTHRKEN